MDNPFRPGFGQYPPELAGRREILDEISGQLRRRDRQGILLSGFRGMGKTVMLREIEDRARAEGLLTVATHARAGFHDDLVNTTLPDALQLLQGKKIGRTVTGISIPGLGGITSSVTESNLAIPNFYTRLRDLLDALDEVNPRSGILLTIDEIEVDALEDLTKIGAAIQQHIGEGRPMLFAAAGIHDRVDALMTRPHTTFLTRARKFDIGPLTWDAARVALLEPIAESGRRITSETLDRATVATEGYPYLTQLVGHLAWNADPDDPHITGEAVDHAITHSVERLGEDVHRPLLVMSSPAQRHYLEALAVSDGSESTATVAARLGMGMTRAANHRRDLIDRGVLLQTAHGAVDFAVPYLRDYIRRHGATPARPGVRRAGTFGPNSSADIAGLGTPEI